MVPGLAALVLALHLLALYAERRGWIFYRTRPPRVRMLGLLEELVDPRVEYMVEEETHQSIRADHSEQGEGYRGPDEPH